MTLPTPQKGTQRLPGDEAVEARNGLMHRFGELSLLFLFVALLAGRFSPSRLDEDVSGPDLRLTYTVVALLLVSFWLAGARKYLPMRMPLIGAAPFTLWCGWMMLSASWAPARSRTIEGLLDFGFLFALILLAWIVMSYLPGPSLERVWTWLVVVGIVYFVTAMLAGPGAQGRYSAPGGGPNTFVRIMVAASIAALYLAIVKRKTLALWLIPAFAIGAALSGSRGGIASAAVVLIVFFIPLIKGLGAKKLIFLLSLLAIGLIVAMSWREGYFVEFVQARFIEQTLVEGYSSGRDEIVDQVWEMFLTWPIIGVGLDGFFALQDGLFGRFQHPHNLVLGTLAEAGIIGGLFLIAAVVQLARTSLQKPYSISSLFALVVGLYFLGSAMFSGDYYDSRFIWFFLGLAAASSLRHRQEAPTLPALSRVPSIKMNLDK